MTSLTFTAVDIVADRYAAAPQLTARLRIEESTGAVIHAIALRCQVRIEPQRRPYSTDDETELLGLFGDRSRWRDTLRPFPWMHCAAMVQGFQGTTEVDLPMPCTYDFEVTGSKYLHALRDGFVPLILLFSGTIFTRGTSGFGVEQVGWDSEASYQLPVTVWQQLIEAHFPGTGWLRLDRDVLRALARYQAEHGLTSFDATIETLLATAPSASAALEEGVP
ncbi:MAG TPA: DUF6084 family protein [Propionibacteriaceae bacterium]|nr:DUF6084 family protein [Propionibacteriaceae bacterium]